MVVQLRKRGKYWSVDYRVGGKRIRKALGTTNKKLARILEPYSEAEGYIFNPKKEQPGKYKYRFEFKKSFQNTVTEAGVEWRTPHTLRHTFAS